MSDLSDLSLLEKWGYFWRLFECFHPFYRYVVVLWLDYTAWNLGEGHHETK